MTKIEKAIETMRLYARDRGADQWIKAIEEVLREKNEEIEHLRHELEEAQGAIELDSTYWYTE